MTQPEFQNYRPGVDEGDVYGFFTQRGYCEFSYARWAWMLSQPGMAGRGDLLSRIGLWRQDGRIVGVACFDTVPGRAYLLTLPGFEELRPVQLRHAEKYLAAGGSFGVFVPEADDAFAALCAAQSYRKTPLTENDLCFVPAGADLTYRLPAGYSVTDLKYTPNYAEYGRVLWKGFDHEKNGEGSFETTGMGAETFRAAIERPECDPSLKVAVQTQDGSFAAFCGMWYDPAAGFAVLEPVATIPECRGLGLGRAAVMEGLRRVKTMGAKTAMVGSSQQFYHALGFAPFAAAALWQKPAP